VINQRPYLFDAIYRWILENGWTPHLLVDTTVQGADVPLHLVQDNKIVLNINPSAIANFNTESFGICFSARFSGTSHQIFVPYAAMTALFSKESGKGMVFPDEEFEENIVPQVIEESKELLDDKNLATSSSKPKREKPSLKLIK